MKKIVSILLAALLLCTMLPLTAGAAFSSKTGEDMEANGQDYAGTYDIPDGYYIIRPYEIKKSADQKELCLGVANDQAMSSGGNIELQDLSTSTTNVFKIEKSDKINAYSIVAVHSGKYLGLEMGGGNVANGTNIAQMTNAYGVWYQRWVFYNAGNGYVTCRTYTNTLSAYMDVKDMDPTVGQNVYVWEKTGNFNQKWKLEKIDMAPGLPGDGTADNPYLIANSNDLSTLADKVADGSDYAGKHFKLKDGFTYTGAPIGSPGHPFCGIFDGNGKTLNVSITKNDTCTGLFAETNGATIKNLEIAGSVSGTNCVGGVVGHAYGKTRIDNCLVSAAVIGSAENVGGIVGMMYDSTVSNCRADSLVRGGWTTIGGIVGWLHNDCNVVNCVRDGETDGDAAVGGIVGYAEEGDEVIANCANFGLVAGSSNCGGIIGLVSSNIDSLKIYSCYANSWMDCDDGCGYICGKSEKSGSGLDGQELYFVKTEAQTSDAVFPSDVAKEVNAGNLSTVLAALNAFATEHAGIVPGATLTAWSQDGNTIFPKSYDGFNIATTGFTLSEGNWWIIAAGGVVVLGGVAAIVIASKKKKAAV